MCRLCEAHGYCTGSLGRMSHARYTQAMAAVCAARGLDLASVALRAAFTAPGPAAILIGARTSAEVRASIEATALPLPEELLMALDTEIQEAAGMTWHEGLPESAPPGL